MVVNVAVLSSLRVHPNRHFGADAAGRGGRAAEDSTSVSSPWVALTTLQHQTTQKVTQNEEYEPIWTHLGGTRTMPNHADPMRCALGHGSSPFLRIGAIHGVTDASREFSFDTCHQRLHRVTLHQSPVSSRDLARI